MWRTAGEIREMKRFGLLLLLPSPEKWGKKKAHIQHQRMYFKFITIYMGKTGREH